MGQSVNSNEQMINSIMVSFFGEKKRDRDQSPRLECVKKINLRVGAVCAHFARSSLSARAPRLTVDKSCDKSQMGISRLWVFSSFLFIHN